MSFYDILFWSKQSGHITTSNVSESETDAYIVHITSNHIFAGSPFG